MIFSHLKIAKSFRGQINTLRMHLWYNQISFFQRVIKKTLKPYIFFLTFCQLLTADTVVIYFFQLINIDLNRASVKNIAVAQSEYIYNIPLILNLSLIKRYSADTPVGCKVAALNPLTSSLLQNKRCTEDVSAEIWCMWGAAARCACLAKCQSLSKFDWAALKDTWQQTVATD